MGRCIGLAALNFSWKVPPVRAKLSHGRTAARRLDVSAMFVSWLLPRITPARRCAVEATPEQLARSPKPWASLLSTTVHATSLRIRRLLSWSRAMAGLRTLSPVLRWSLRTFVWRSSTPARAKNGTLADHIRLLCYGYDPASGTYTVAIGRLRAAKSV